MSNGIVSMGIGHNTSYYKMSIVERNMFHLPRQFNKNYYNVIEIFKGKELSMHHCTSKICMHRETMSICSQKKNVSMWSFMKDFCVKDGFLKKAKSINNSIMDLTKKKN
jgi:hypothetical protein